MAIPSKEELIADLTKQADAGDELAANALGAIGIFQMALDQRDQSITELKSVLEPAKELAALLRSDDVRSGEQRQALVKLQSTLYDLGHFKYYNPKERDDVR